MLVTDLNNSEDLRKGFQGALVENTNIILRTAHPAETVRDFAQSVSDGLSRSPPMLDSRFLYDARGSELYEEITRQPEYYPTRTETEILHGCAQQIRELTGPVTLLELGSGNSAKTDTLLSAYLARDREVCYVPVDVSQSALNRAGLDICERHSRARVIAINGCYHDAFPLFKAAAPVMVLFLGSSIGNLDVKSTKAFLQEIAVHLHPGSFFLLGIDLVKDSRILNAAYNDAAGVTEAFTRNLFTRMNRELGANLDISLIEHRAHYNEKDEQIEIDARFASEQVLHIAPLGKTFRFKAGEQLRTEISRKFHLKPLSADLRSPGFILRHAFTDPKNWFALLLWQRSNEKIH